MKRLPGIRHIRWFLYWIEVRQFRALGMSGEIDDVATRILREVWAGER